MKSTTLSALIALAYALRTPGHGERALHASFEARVNARGYKPENRENPTFATAVPSQQSIITPLIKNVVSKEQVMEFMNGLSAFPERYYKSQNGAKSGQGCYV